MTDRQVRVRFAPSPTGALHVGSVRTALFNWLYARHHKGTFILRIEDTDVARSTEESTRQILESMQWLGLDVDEGPFYQSQRNDLYRNAVESLLEQGKAYRCFCTPEEIERERQEARAAGEDYVYSGKCRSLTPEQVNELMRQGKKAAVRLKVDNNEEVSFSDRVFGEIKMSAKKFGDIIIQRSDDTPTYNLAVVVDDHKMGITCVIRGDDHVPNTPKQIVLYRALGYDVPEFAHLPLILGPDRTRLSKRHGATSVLELRDQGFLPEAVMNYLALLGWSYNETTQIMSAEELIERFSLDHVSRSAAIFDMTKFKWMNGHYMRSLPEERVVDAALNYLHAHGYTSEKYEKSWLEGIINLEIPRSSNFEELLDHLLYFLEDEIAYDSKAVKKHLEKEKSGFYLKKVLEILEAAPDFTEQSLEPAFRDLAAHLEVGLGKVIQPLRVSLTGKSATPGIFDVLHFLGRERVFKRIHYALENLCSVKEA